MKKVLLLVLVAGGGWWYFQGGRVLSEESVKDFYQQQAMATLNRNPEALCNQLASDYQSSSVLISSEGRAKQEENKKQSCDALTGMYASFEELGEKMGGMLQLDYDYKIRKITISNDKKSAVVEASFTLDVAGSIMNFSGSSVDTLIRRNGKVMVLRSEGTTRVSSG
jgi:hypothetical protein